MRKPLRFQKAIASLERHLAQTHAELLALRERVDRAAIEFAELRGRLSSDLERRGAIEKALFRQALSPSVRGDAAS